MPSATFGSGKGRLGRATREWASSAALSGAAGVLAELAKDAADLADLARSQENGSAYLSAAARLQSLVERVERSGDRSARGSGDDGGAGGLAAELGAGPEVGDSADS